MIKGISESEVIELLKNDTRIIKDITALTGIQQTRVHRIRKEGYALWASEYLSLIKLYFGADVNAIADRLLTDAKLTLDKARLDARIHIEETKKWAVDNIGNMQLDEMEKQVALRYGIPVELLRWRLADPKLATTSLGGSK